MLQKRASFPFGKSSPHWWFQLLSIFLPCNFQGPRGLYFTGRVLAPNTVCTWHTHKALKNHSKLDEWTIATWMERWQCSEFKNVTFCCICLERGKKSTRNKIFLKQHRDLVTVLWEYPRIRVFSEKSTPGKCWFQLIDTFLYKLHIILIGFNYSLQMQNKNGTRRKWNKKENGGRCDNS